MSRKLTSMYNEKASILLLELINEIKEVKENNKYFTFDLNENMSEQVGTFKSTCVYGLYNKRLNKISLNEKLIENGTNHQIKEVLMHELIHSIGIHNHKWQFKNMAWRVQNVLKYDVQHARYENVFPKQDREQTAKYKVVCSNCGQTYYRQRKTNLVTNPKRYTCGNCHVKKTLETVTV